MRYVRFVTYDPFFTVTLTIKHTRSQLGLPCDTIDENECRKKEKGVILIKKKKKKVKYTLKNISSTVNYMVPHKLE